MLENKYWKKQQQKTKQQQQKNKTKKTNKKNNNKKNNKKQQQQNVTSSVTWFIHWQTKFHDLQNMYMIQWIKTRMHFMILFHVSMTSSVEVRVFQKLSAYECTFTKTD